MFLLLIFNFLFGHCELILFVHYKESNKCDLYVGVYATDFAVEYELFLSPEKRLNERMFRCKYSPKTVQTAIYFEGYYLEFVNKEYYEEIRNLAEKISDIDIREKFIGSKEYYKYSIDINLGRQFYFDILFRTKKEKKNLYAPSQAFNLDGNFKFCILKLGEIIKLNKNNVMSNSTDKNSADGELIKDNRSDPNCTGNDLENERKKSEKDQNRRSPSKKGRGRNKKNPRLPFGITLSVLLYIVVILLVILIVALFFYNKK
ncbi:putative SP-containing membrane protein [Vairimorpha necatrix]|uniref:SP-containing membrane protein n=1 Tax=Vairimorpha necatrix TaxID=6039 RepID=A0AAX4J9A8_9MICR